MERSTARAAASPRRLSAIAKRELMKKDDQNNYARNGGAGCRKQNTSKIDINSNHLENESINERDAQNTKE